MNKQKKAVVYGTLAGILCAGLFNALVTSFDIHLGIIISILILIFVVIGVNGLYFLNKRK